MTNTKLILNGLGTPGVRIDFVSPLDMTFSADDCRVVVHTKDQIDYDVYWFDGHGDGCFRDHLSAQEVTEVSIRFG